MKKTDILIIGGGPAGMVSASTAKEYYPNKKIMLVKSVEQGCIPCGIPYMFSSLDAPDENKLGVAPLKKKGVKVIIDKALEIDREEKIVKSENDQYRYEKLILAIGSSPIIPPIPGIDKKGIFSIKKELTYLKDVVSEVKKSRNILIVGGGFIGVEFADEISNIDDLNVSLVEMLSHLLLNSFDSEFSKKTESKLKSKGVNVLTDNKVVEFLGGDHVEEAKLSNGNKIPVDKVILGIGAKPNTELAIDSGIDLGRGNGIWVDEYMRTSDTDIFAVGDCAGKRDFYTRKDAPVMLASTATAESRIAGANLYKLKVIRENKGTIAIYSTYVDGLVLGSAGLTERSAKKGEFEIVKSTVEVKDKHPSTLPNTNNLKVKLIFSKQSGIILGGQVAGGNSCGEIINLIGVAIQKRMSFVELETLQMATHPYLTSSPTKYPIVLAAQKVFRKF